MKKFLSFLAIVFFTTIAEAQLSSCNADFSYSANGLAVTFTDSSYGTTAPTDWNWNFGDGFSSVQQNPVHTYSQPGSFAVCLTVYKPFTSCQSSFCDTITVAGTQSCIDTSQVDSSVFCTPVFDPVCGCDSITYSNSCEAYYYGGVTSFTPGACGSQGNCYAAFWYAADSSGQNTINFYDASSFGTNAYLWDFGDGSSSTGQNPVYTYALGGQYDVCLITWDSLGCSDTICQNIFVGNPGSCYASYSYFPDSANAMLIYFTDFSYNADSISYWYWQFGDGTTDTVPDPVHLYAAGGSYTVCLDIMDNNGCSNSYCNFVVVGNQSSCYAFYSYTPDSIDPFAYHFTDLSSASATDWYWDFGDGDTSMFQNPSHTFDSAGTYSVCLSINDSVNSCTNFYCDLITVNNCSALFAWAQDSADPNTIYFTDNSAGNITGWQWDFGDGSATSSAPNPNHTYLADGGYWVCLTITDSVSSCTQTFCDAVYAGFQSSCKAYFSNLPDTADPFTINFLDYSFGSPGNWYWTFGDGSSSSLQNPSHTYSLAGTYQVCLNISDSSGNCSDSLCDYVTVAGFSSCMAYYTYSNPFGNWISFSDSSSGSPSSYYWDFGDGGTSSQQNPFHNFPDTGVYLVCLTISDSATNCFNTYCNYVYLGTQPPACIASFFSNVAGNAVSFTDASIGNISNYLWDFGDNSFDTVASPTHAYTDSGWYNVCLTISDFGTGCFNTFCDSVYIAPSPGGCQANFSYTAFGNMVMFSDASSGNPIAWSWDFGDFQSSVQQNPSHIYPFEFTYTACLTITAANGCYDTYCDSVIIVGMEEAVPGNSFLIFPNPAKDHLFIRNLSAGNEKFTLKIFSPVGELVDQKVILNSTGMIDFSERAAGLYLITLEGDQSVLHKRVMIVK